MDTDKDPTSTSKGTLEVAKDLWDVPNLCPRPWVAKTLMIEDAKGQVVAHFGGMTWAGNHADPYFTTAMVAFIVDAVNEQEAKKQDKTVTSHGQ